MSSQKHCSYIETTYTCKLHRSAAAVTFSTTQKTFKCVMSRWRNFYAIPKQIPPLLTWNVLSNFSLGGTKTPRELIFSEEHGQSPFANCCVSRFYTCKDENKGQICNSGFVVVSWCGHGISNSRGFSKPTVPVLTFSYACHERIYSMLTQSRISCG